MDQVDAAMDGLAAEIDRLRGQLLERQAEAEMLKREAQAETPVSVPELGRD
jgi:hypothetical protein